MGIKERINPKHQTLHLALSTHENVSSLPTLPLPFLEKYACDTLYHKDYLVNVTTRRGITVMVFSAISVFQNKLSDGYNIGKGTILSYHSHFGSYSPNGVEGRSHNHHAI